MKEQIEDIALSVKKRRELETEVNANVLAVGRANTFFKGDNIKIVGEQILWIILHSTHVDTQSDFNGNFIGTHSEERRRVKGLGLDIQRDSKVGGILIQHHNGKHIYQAPKTKKNIEIEILNRATYSPNKSVDTDKYASDILINLAGNNKTYSFRSISEILEKQLDIDQEKERLKNLKDFTSEEAIQLIQRIEKKEEDIRNYLDKAQGFIRKYAELRFQPILDPIQESIKRSNIFVGNLIINGGPGTGKTTSLIQRIKFLISPTINEFISLSDEQKDMLFDQNKSWIFYSPNELLALYLRNSMKMENLFADSDKVKVWSLHKNVLVKSYKFVDTSTKRPFLIYNKPEGKSLLKNGPEYIKSVIDDFLDFYIRFQKEKIKKVIEIDTKPFKWKNVGISIQKYIQDKKINSIEDLILLFLNLNELYKSDSDFISDDYSLQIKKVAARIQVEINVESERATTLSDLLSSWKSNTQEVEDDDDDDTDIEQEDFEEQDDQTVFEYEKELFLKLKALCRKQALKQLDKSVKFSKRDKELLKIIPEVENQPEYVQIGQTAFYKKYFERITKGIVANLFREIPSNYKKFRRKQLNLKSRNYDISILEELVKKDKNSRIHGDEQAFLLYFVNELCYKLATEFKPQYNSISHPYVNAFKSNCKAVIGIDEATDFSLIDLLAINSFRHPSISSVTLSGDVMQRMTEDGLKSWSDFITLNPKTEIKNLEVSYRQSPTLLLLAQKLYKKSTGKKALYKSYIQQDEAEPKPLMIISKNEEEKLIWISERIIEIYKSYGDTIPSIAIFLPHESLLESFATKLGNIDTLADVGIYVKACRNGEVLGDKDTVRVFSIDKIKGLEFEAVFFHDFDTIQNQNLSKDLLLKYLYVGISRATFYLGMTINENLSTDLKFLQNSIDKSGKTWRN